MGSDDDLPTVVARMWGREPASRRGPRPGLTLRRITDAAIAIADAEGLAGVRMSSVAARLDVSTMSLYGYVTSKDDLLTAMVDAAAPDPPEPGTLAWRDYLTRWTRAHRDFLAAHPWLLEVSPLTPPVGPRTLRWLDRALTVLGGAGLGGAEAVNIASTLSAYAVSAATLQTAMSGTVDEAGPEGPAGYTALLARLVDPGGYPGLAAAIESGAFGAAPDWVEDADFTFGLTLLLDGIEALIARRRRSAGPGARRRP
ncbi:TetR family transcriptional regulator [[Actinomadura] parvosata subsp. kistnae]|uniref:TetR family transcriptional regulator n=1 Tax=[Actinomadura] parvosata subsp. kistnae TaxID=1909395 RepID=A0A1U9ZXC7_9ACTN|nr:TetR/AcrR family transcriptional regulator C-terminal domain-containing protein [Nonomuraea sp. ATCC 55076]AQZ62600.1 TetR family transcriptional regulator [Nonomuraea sp. ATCC 55076]